MPHTVAISSSSQDVFENFYKQHLARRLLTGAMAGINYVRSQLHLHPRRLSFPFIQLGLFDIYCIYIYTHINPMKNDGERKDSLDVTSREFLN